MPDDLLIALIESKLDSAIEDVTTRTGFAHGIVSHIQHTVFATENPTAVFFRFKVVWDCVDATEQARANAHLTIQGDGTFDIIKSEITSVRPIDLSLRGYELDGSPLYAGIAYASAHFQLGHAEKTRSIRFPLS